MGQGFECGGIGSGQAVSSGARSRIVSRSLSCSEAKRRSSSSVAEGNSTTTAGFPLSARSAFRMTATSMASCSNAPAAGAKSQCGDHHGDDRQRHSRGGALQGDMSRPARDIHRIGEPVQAIGGQHDVGSFR